jgi:hypothetical protein
VRKPTPLGGKGDWEYEIGEPPAATGAGGSVGAGGGALLAASGSNPLFFRCDTRADFVWKVRNVPWAIDNYTVSAEGAELVLRTANKKYYKRFRVPDLDRAGLEPDAAEVAVRHAGTTLEITYPKPQIVLEREELAREHRRTIAGGKSKEGEVECNQQ